MITRSICFIIVLIVVHATANAQDSSIVKNSHKIKFHSFNQIGILKGQRRDPEIVIQSINGIQLKEFFLGLGAGIDYYEYRTIPLFVDVRRSMPFFNQSTFVYVDAGMNLPWDKSEKDSWRIYRYKKSLYYDIGLGYQVNVSKNSAFLISAGYTQKDLEIKQTPFYTQGGEIIYGNPSEYSYEFRRVVVKFGWKF